MRRMAALAVLMVAGCATSHTPTEAEIALDELEAAACARSVRCEGPSGMGLSSDYFTPCGGHPLFELGAAAVARGAVSLDALALADCLEAMRFAPCRAVDYAVGLSRCESLFVPMLADGDVCRPGPVDGCTGGCAVAGPASCGGQCVPRAAIGEPCSDRLCAEGAHCDAGADLRCRARPSALGEACDETFLCAGDGGTPYPRRESYLACIGGVCELAPARTRGERCGPELGNCGPDDFCDGPSTTSTCVPRAPLGSACTSPSGCVADAFCGAGVCSESAIGSRCAASGTGSFSHAIDSCAEEGLLCVGYPARCAEAAAIGASCDADEGRPCGLGARCVLGECEPVVALGADCTDGDACALGTACIDGRRTEPPRFGEPCTVACLDGDCIDGRCEHLPDGAACARRYIESCTGYCQGESCAPGVAEGGACGFTVGICDAGLECRGGVCAPPCS
jgi:hypothetical protein